MHHGEHRGNGDFLTINIPPGPVPRRTPSRQIGTFVFCLLSFAFCSNPNFLLPTSYFLLPTSYFLLFPLSSGAPSAFYVVVVNTAACFANLKVHLAEVVGKAQAGIT